MAITPDEALEEITRHTEALKQASLAEERALLQRDVAILFAYGRHGLSQTKIAEAANLTQQAVSLILSRHATKALSDMSEADARAVLEAEVNGGHPHG